MIAIKRLKQNKLNLLTIDNKMSVGRNLAKNKFYEVKSIFSLGPILTIYFFYW